MPSIRLPQARSSKLANGLKYILYSNHENKIVCLQMIVRMGSAFESGSERGFSHLIEHLSFKSTKSFVNNDISDFLSSMGISVNAYTDFDSTCYYMLLPTEKLEVALMAMSELVCRPRFTELNLKAERAIIIEEIRQYDSDPESAFIENIQYDYFKDNPLKYPIIGTKEQIKAVKLEQLQSFYEVNYRPQNSYIVACGSFDPDTFTGLLEKYFSTWGADGDCPLPHSMVSQYLMPEVNGFRCRKVPVRTDMEYIALVLPELSELNPDSEHLLFAMRYLAIGKSSLLYKRLIEQEKLCSAVRVLSISGLMTGISIVLLAPLPAKNIHKIIKAVREELDRVIHVRIPDRAFELVRKDIIHSWHYGFDTMEGFCSSLAAEELIGDYERLYKYPEHILSIDSIQVQKRVAQTWIADNIALYYLGSNADSWKYLSSMESRDWFTYATSDFPVTYPDEVTFSDHFGKQLIIKNHCGYVLNQINTDVVEAYTIDLSNGLRVIFQRVKHRPLTGFALAVNKSQMNETHNERGLNLFTTTSMLYGTRTKSHDQILDFSRSLGLNLRVIHHLDCTTWRGKCYNTDLSAALLLLSELFHTPRFDVTHLQTLKHSTIDSIRRDKVTPGAYSFNRWFKMLTGSKTNLDRSSGTIEQVKRIKIEDIQKWHQDHLLNNSSISLSIVGDYEPREIGEIVQNCFGLYSYRNNGIDTCHPFFSPNKRHFLMESKGFDQSIIHLGALNYCQLDPLQDTAMQIICQAIGGEIASRFYMILREKHSYTYQSGMDFNAFQKLGFWAAFVYCAPEDYQKVYSLVLEIIRDIHINGLSETEIENSRNYLLGMQRFDAESLSWNASAIASLSCLNYPRDHFFQREQRLKSVNKSIIDQVASFWFNPELLYSYIME